MTVLPSNHEGASTVSRTRKPAGLPQLSLSDGSLEALKWLALGLMVLDHINKHLLSGEVEAFFALGRMVMPIFAIVLAYNLARPGAFERGVHVRSMRRLAVTGVIAAPPFMALGGLGWGWWPVNIMGTLLVATSAVFLIEQGGTARIAAAGGLLLAGGLVVEYWWPALAILLSAWWYFRRPKWLALLACSAGLACLYPVNHNWWAFAAVPVVLFASRIDIPLPRSSWFFHVAYPLHLALIWLAQRMM